MKKILTKIYFLFALSLMSNYNIGQVFCDIQLGASEILNINGLILHDNLTFEHIVDALGVPDRQTENLYSSKNHIYDEIGITITTMENEFHGIFLNFIDGDGEFFPENSFNGRLIIGETGINKFSTEEDFENISNFEFICKKGIICGFNTLESKTSISVIMNKDHLVNLTILVKPLKL